MASAPKLVPIRRKPAKLASPLTPELREFIDRAIVPALVKQYLSELDGENELAKPNACMPKSDSNTAAPILRG